MMLIEGFAEEDHPGGSTLRQCVSVKLYWSQKVHRDAGLSD